MEMEVVAAVPPPPIPMDFNFDSNCSSPYMTAPSSPQRFGNFFCSAPTSPTRVSSFFHQLNNNLAMPRHSSADSSPPSHWEEEEPKPHSQPSNNNNNDGNEDFEFNFSGHLERPSLSADELFDGGKIRPLKLTSTEKNASSTRQGKKIVHGASHKRDSDPFAEEESSTRKREQEEGTPEKQQKRGRERASSSTTCHKGSRSMSPLRNNSDIACEGGVSSSTSDAKTSATFSSFLSSISFTKGYRKWRLKDFLLFRSASEGRATDKDPLRRKYEVLSRRAAEEDVRNSSFRSTESSGSVSRRGPVSAHELHYTVNRAASEEMKKKTMLPYKQGLLGCLGFNPGVHQISRGIGSLARS